MNHCQVIDFIILFISKFKRNAYFLCACSRKRLIDNLLSFLLGHHLRSESHSFSDEFLNSTT